MLINSVQGLTPPHHRRSRREFFCRRTAPSQAAITAELVVEVHDHERAADELVSSAEEAGGYFASRSYESVRLRVRPLNTVDLSDLLADFR